MYIFSRDTPCLWYSMKCQTRGVSEVIFAQRTCMPRDNSRWLLDLSRKQSIVWVPGYHSFPKWAILYPRSLWDMRALFDHMHKCFKFWIKVNRFDPQSGNGPYMPLCVNSCVNEDNWIIDRFHMTSRRPYLCTKQWISGHVCVQKKSCGNWTLFTCMFKTFFYSKQFAKLLTTWLKTISIVWLAVFITKGWGKCLIWSPFFLNKFIPCNFKYITI